MSRNEKNDNGIVQLDEVRKSLQDGKIKAQRAAKKLSSIRNEDRPSVSRAVLVIGIIVILLLVYVIADLASGGILSIANGKVVSALTRNSSERFSVATDADNVYAFQPYRSGYVILTENGITCINSSGNAYSRQQLTYSNPSFDIKGNRVLVFDRGSDSYSLFRNESFYSQMSAENDIIDGAVSKKDNYALAVRDENAKSILYGFNGSGKVIYQWNCPDGFISDVVMNSSGSKVAVTVVNSKNAVLSSKVYILDFEYDSAYAEFEYNEEIVIGVEFLTNKRVQVITDKNVYLIKGRDQKVVYSYGSADICYSAISSSEKLTAIITNDHTHDDYYTLSVFSSNGKLKYSVPVTGKVMDVAVSDKSVAVLFDHKTETYSKWGKLAGSTQDINYNDEIVINGNYLFVLSSESVRRFSAYGSTAAVYEYEDETM
ncbi:MAG: hypothetical protein IKV76_05270 [Clostridia bacterium]|nr:hypothetical protein [Clostridia bacterium]